MRDPEFADGQVPLGDERSAWGQTPIRAQDRHSWGQTGGNSAILQGQGRVRGECGFGTHTTALETRGIIPKSKGDVISSLAPHQPDYEEHVSGYTSSLKIDLLPPCSENDLKMCSIERGSNPERRGPSEAQKTGPPHSRRAEGPQPPGTAGSQQAGESGCTLRKRAFS